MVLQFQLSRANERGGSECYAALTANPFNIRLIVYRKHLRWLLASILHKPANRKARAKFSEMTHARIEPNRLVFLSYSKLKAVSCCIHVYGETAHGH